MGTYILSRDNKLYTVWSDNTDECSYDVFPIEKEYTYDLSVDTPETFSYDDVRAVDSSLVLLTLMKEGQL